jgi:hypothetical protein
MLGSIKKLFGGGTTKKDRATSPVLDELSPDNVPDGAIAALWELMDGRYPETNKRIRASIDLRAGKLRPFMHPNWDMEDRETLRADGPEKYERPRRTVRRLAAKKARIKRPAAGESPLSKRQSSRIEDFADGYMAEQYPDNEVVDLLGNEGETLMLQVPMPSHWEKIPTLYDEFEDEGKHTKAADYEKLPEHRKREYEKADSKGTTYKRMKKRYRLDKSGEPDDGREDFEVDLKKSAKYYAEERDDAYARHLPVLMRGPISRLDFVPINPRFVGKRTEVDGVIIRTLYRKSMLKRDYRWEGCDTTLLEPVTAYDGNTDGELYLYELWAYDEWRRPYVAYQVGTKSATWADDAQNTAVIKLWEEYPGCTELPIAFEYGQHNAGADADLRTMTITQPYQQNWLQRDGILTAMAISTAESGYPTWGQKITKDGVEAMRALGGDIPLEFTMQPNTVVPLIGDLVELTSKGTNNDVGMLLQALDALNEKELASPGAFGGEGPTSGLDRQVQGKDMEVSYGDIIEGGRRIKERTARHALMLCTAIGKKCDRPVELYVMGDSPAPQSGDQSPTRTRVKLPVEICGDNWDVIAEFPHVPGENLAGTSLFADLAGKKLILDEEFRTLWGDPHPEMYAGRLAIQEYFKSPAGQLDALQGMAEYLADDRLKKTLELVNNGRMTGKDGGVSTAAMDDLVSGGQPHQAGMPGMQVPNVAASALGGGNAGAISASMASAGSPMDGGMGQGGMAV